MRTWPGLAAIGAGLVHLGASVGAAPVALTPLLLVGVAEVLWGVLALSRPVPPYAPQAATGVAGVLVGTVVALLLPASAARHGFPVELGLAPVAVAGAGVLDLALGVLLAVHLGRDGGIRADSRPLRFVGEAAAAAVIVAVVVAQSLAATSVGSAPMRMH